MLLHKIKRIIQMPCLIPFRLDEARIITLPDEKYLKYRYRIQMGKKLDLKNPKTYNEKLQWLKIHDRNPEYTKMVDKYDVKKYVSDLIGEEYIIPTLGVYDSFEEIDFDKLPNQFVIKCTHDSGSVVICKDNTNFDIESAQNKINKSLEKNYFYSGREWPYKNIKPRIIVEKYIEDIKGKLFDYKLMCFNGRVDMSFVCTDREKNDLKVTFFDRNWHKLPFERHYKSSDEKILKPKQYDLMIELAEKLSKNIPFVRVDFYEINNKIYFGELTFYPGSGFEEFKPEEWDYKLGELVKLDKVKENEK